MSKFKINYLLALFVISAGLLQAAQKTPRKFGGPGRGYTPTAAAPSAPQIYQELLNNFKIALDQLQRMQLTNDQIDIARADIRPGSPIALQLKNVTDAIEALRAQAKLMQKPEIMAEKVEQQVSRFLPILDGLENQVNARVRAMTRRTPTAPAATASAAATAATSLVAAVGGTMPAPAPTPTPAPGTRPTLPIPSAPPAPTSVPSAPPAHLVIPEPVAPPTPAPGTRPTPSAPPAHLVIPEPVAAPSRVPTTVIPAPVSAPVTIPVAGPSITPPRTTTPPVSAIPSPFPVPTPQPRPAPAPVAQVPVLDEEWQAVVTQFKAAFEQLMQYDPTAQDAKIEQKGGVSRLYTITQSVSAVLQKLRTLVGTNSVKREQIENFSDDLYALSKAKKVQAEDKLKKAAAPGAAAAPAPVIPAPLPIKSPYAPAPAVPIAAAAPKVPAPTAAQLLEEGVPAGGVVLTPTSAPVPTAAAPAVTIPAPVEKLAPEISKALEGLGARITQLERVDVTKDPRIARGLITSIDSEIKRLESQIQTVAQTPARKALSQILQEYNTRFGASRALKATMPTAAAPVPVPTIGEQPLAPRVPKTFESGVSVAQPAPYSKDDELSKRTAATPTTELTPIAAPARVPISTVAAPIPKAPPLPYAPTRARAAVTQIPVIKKEQVQERLNKIEKQIADFASKTRIDRRLLQTTAGLLQTEIQTVRELVSQLQGDEQLSAFKKLSELNILFESNLKEKEQAMASAAAAPSAAAPVAASGAQWQTALEQLNVAVSQLRGYTVQPADRVKPGEEGPLFDLIKQVKKLYLEVKELAGTDSKKIKQSEALLNEMVLLFKQKVKELPSSVAAPLAAAAPVSVPAPSIPKIVVTPPAEDVAKWQLALEKLKAVASDIEAFRTAKLTQETAKVLSGPIMTRLAEAESLISKILTEEQRKELLTQINELRERFKKIYESRLKELKAPSSLGGGRREVLPSTIKPALDIEKQVETLDDYIDQLSDPGASSEDISILSKNISRNIKELEQLIRPLSGSAQKKLADSLSALRAKYDKLLVARLKELSSAAAAPTIRSLPRDSARDSDRFNKLIDLIEKQRVLLGDAQTRRDTKAVASLIAAIGTTRKQLEDIASSGTEDQKKRLEYLKGPLGIQIRKPVSERDQIAAATELIDKFDTLKRDQSYGTTKDWRDARDVAIDLIKKLANYAVDKNQVIGKLPKPGTDFYTFKNQADKAVEALKRVSKNNVDNDEYKNLQEIYKQILDLKNQEALAYQAPLTTRAAAP